MKKKTLDQFIQEAKNIHGDTYDYGKVDYINGETPVEIICNKHGSFFQKPVNHLRGKGCKLCGEEKSKRKKRIFGYNDIGCNENGKESRAYVHWKSMMLRCYSEKSLNRLPTYRECYVCNEWLTFSNFKKWFDKNYIEGYSLDKDIIIKGNKIYSPETCCFVPVAINNIVIKRKKYRGTLPIGVGRSKNRFRSFIHNRHLGVFDTPGEAFLAYKKAKEEEIVYKATYYFKNGMISERVYNALINHKVEITD